ncbi:AMP-binding protein, partial [Glutamicibacter arilaitensis]
MQEVTVELLTALAPEVNTTNLLLDRVARGAQRPLFSVQRDGVWHELSAGAFLTDVKRLAMTLINDGLQPGDKVAIISRTRYEWALAEEAIWFAGGVTVPIYETSSAFQIEWILRDSGARVVFAENHELRANVRQAAAQLGESVRTHIFEGSDTADKSLIPSAGLHQLMVPASQVDEQLIESRRASMALEDVATMVYTSGTTGRPKGCNMTHSNFAMVAHNLAEHMLE